MANLTAGAQRSRGAGGCLWWAGRIGMVPAGLAILFISLAFLAGRRAMADLKAKYPPVGQLVEISDASNGSSYKLHLSCQGEGSPTVIMESGITSPGLIWALVQPEVARFTRACVYDRAGLGWSELSPRPRTVDVQNEELYHLLNRAGMRGPYVLVGYSSGGWTMRMYAHTYPEGVAGMVLVDSAHEEQIERLGGEGTPLARRMLEIGPALVRSGIPALAARLLPVPGKNQLPPEMVSVYQALLASDPRFAEAMVAEILVLEENLALVRAAKIKNLGEIPLVVLAHGRMESIPGVRLPPNAEQVWLELQRELAGLSPQGRLIVVQDSGHDILFERPDLVVDAIRQVVAESRTAVR